MSLLRRSLTVTLQTQQDCLNDSNEDLSPDQSSENKKRPTFWRHSYISHMVLCLFPSSLILLTGISYLPKKHHNVTLGEVTSVAFTLAGAAISLFALITFIKLTRKIENLQAEGIALWPCRCRHCLCHIQLHIQAQTQPKETISTSKTGERSEYASCEYPSAINKSKLNINYIFCFLVMCLFVLRTFVHIVCLCLFSDSFNSYEKYEVIVNIILDIYTLCTIYFVNCRFIPTFFDAHLVAVPKVRWSMVLIVGFSLWQAISTLMEPLDMLVDDGGPVMLNCWGNGTFHDVLHGIFDILDPFYVELLVMNSWFMVALWSRFCPRLDKHIPNSHSCIRETQGMQNSEVQRSWLSFPRWRGMLKLSKNRSYRSQPEGQPLLPVTTVSNLPAGGDDVEVQCRNMATAGSPTTPQRKNRQKRKLTKRIELSVGLVLVTGCLYFGISKLILVEYSGEDDVKGRYIQWILRMFFFTPGLFLIMQQRRMERKCKRNNRTKDLLDLTCIDKRKVHSDDVNSRGSHKIFIFLLTGASLYLIACLVAAFGNLCNANFLTKEMINLNVVSSVTSLFELFRKNLEGMFLLCVQSQQPANDREREWTLICLVYICTVNAFQWFWDSIVHEVSSPLAWPVFDTFFQGHVGKVIGILLVPCVHIYELHVTVFAYQVFKIIQ